jgi:hypothetical protein
MGQYKTIVKFSFLPWFWFWDFFSNGQLQLCYLLLLHREIGNISILNYSQNEVVGVEENVEDIEDEVQEMEVLQGNLNFNRF